MTLLLIVVGSLLIFMNVKAVKKGQNSFSKIMNITEEDMTEIEFRINEMRKEFAETILELQTEIVSLKKEVAALQKDKGILASEELEFKLIEEDQTEEIYEELVLSQEDSDELEASNRFMLENDTQKTSSNSVKIDEIRELFKSGRSIEEIASQLNMGKGEVLLIKELYLR